MSYLDAVDGIATHLIDHGRYILDTVSDARPHFVMT